MPRLLDLFCGAGGAAMGYHRAGFDIVGVDISPQPHYPFEFVQADALDLFGERCADLTVDDVGVERERGDDDVCELGRRAIVAVGRLDVEVDEDGAGHVAPLVGVLSDSPKPAFHVKDFDAIHASPPCQAHTLMQSVARNGHAHPDMIAPTRDLLKSTGLPYVIENVVGAPLRSPITLCGAALGLAADGRHLARHRLFECSFPMLTPGCAHGSRAVIGIYGDHARKNRRHSQQSQYNTADGLKFASEAMGIDWMTWPELVQAIPPAYTELIGHQLLQHLRVAA